MIISGYKQIKFIIVKEALVLTRAGDLFRGTVRTIVALGTWLVATHLKNNRGFNYV